MNVPLNIIRQSGQPQDDLRDHYESVTLDVLRTLWRRRLLIGAAVVMTMAAAMALLALLPRQYSAEALIQLDFLRQNTGVTAPAAAVEASALVQSDVRYISSRAMMRKVAMRFASEDAGGTSAGHGGLQGWLDALRRLILPETIVADPLERASKSIERHLQVSNVTRAYLIVISFTADTPQRAADVANAFAQEFFTDKRLQDLARQEAEAHQEVLRLSSVYGAQHPLLLAAQERFAFTQSQLGEERQRIRATPSYPPAGVAFIAAQPVDTPSMPNGKLFLAVALLLGGAFGVGAALLAERRDVGFRTADEVFRVTGVRCAGVIPDSDPEQVQEAIRALCFEAGIVGYDKAPKVVLISTPLADGAVAHFFATLAEALVASGHRVLSIHANPPRAKQTPSATAASEPVPEDEQAVEIVLSRRAHERHTVFSSGRGADSAGHSPLRSIEALTAGARKFYDAVLIETPPVLTSSDALRLTSICDIHLHVVGWRKTRRLPTVLAVQRFRKLGARISAIVLIDVNLRGYREYRVADQFYYLGEPAAKDPGKDAAAKARGKARIKAGASSP